MFLPLGDDTPRLRPPVVTLALVASCTAMFLYTLALDAARVQALVRGAGAVPWEITHLRDLAVDGRPTDLVPLPFTLLSSLFIHGDVAHLVGNMWFLWIFGSKLEGCLGSARFLGFYAAAGLTAALLQVAAAPGSMLPMIGASGAIAGVLGGYAVRLGRARVRCLVLLLFWASYVELPALVLLGLWLLVQLAAAGGGGEPGVAWYAHIGGFVAGLVLGRLAARGAGRGPVRMPGVPPVVYHAPA